MEKNAYFEVILMFFRVFFRDGEGTRKAGSNRAGVMNNAPLDREYGHYIVKMLRKLLSGHTLSRYPGRKCAVGYPGISAYGSSALH